jgi:hypothetical protein
VREDRLAVGNARIRSEGSPDELGLVALALERDATDHERPEQRSVPRLVYPQDPHRDRSIAWPQELTGEALFWRKVGTDQTCLTLRRNVVVDADVVVTVAANTNITRFVVCEHDRDHDRDYDRDHDRDHDHVRNCKARVLRSDRSPLSSERGFPRERPAWP